MDYNDMTFLELTEAREKINNAIEVYHEREKFEVYTVKTGLDLDHYESVANAANRAIEVIKLYMVDKEDLSGLFDMGFELRIDKFTKSEIEKCVIQSKEQNQ